MYSLRSIEQVQDVLSALYFECKASRTFSNVVVQHAISYKWYMREIERILQHLMLHVCNTDVLFANKWVTMFNP